MRQMINGGLIDDNAAHCNLSGNKKMRQQGSGSMAVQLARLSGCVKYAAARTRNESAYPALSHGSIDGHDFRV
jgi:hypothetical protein